MKAKTLLVAAVLLLGLTATALAQVPGATFTVSSTPVTTVTQTGYTELTGSITFTTIVGSPATAQGTFTVQYPVAITNTAAVITGYTGNVGILPAIAATSNFAAGTVIINVQAGFAGAFTLSGIRVQIAGTPVTSLSAQISGVNNLIVSGQTNPQVVVAIGTGLVFVSGTAGQFNLLTGATITQPVMKVKEGYLNAYGISKNDPAAAADVTNGVIIRFTLSALPPAGYNISFPGTANTDSTGVFQTALVTEASDGTAATVAASGNTVTVTSTSTSLKVYYQLVTTSDPTKIETLTVNPTITYTGTLPVPSATITWTATFSPIGIGLTSAGAVPSPAFIPRYQAAEVGPGTLIGPPTGVNNSVLLFPYATTATAIGYYTGISIANTTWDPGVALPSPITGAIQQAGTITFYFYQAQSGTTAPKSYSYTTSASSPGSGLDATGKLPAGSTYVVLSSDLQKAAAMPADFTGYMIVVTNFANAHGQYFVSDFKTFSNGGQAMVINSARTAAVGEGLTH